MRTTMSNGVISISMENTKMGPIPSFSLPPGLSCNKCSPCVCRGCYARRLYLRRKSVASAWNNNWDIVTAADIDLWRRQMNGWLMIYRPVAFRIHVSGDFFCCRYFQQWCSIAADNPDVKFFAFTKQWNVIRSFRDREIPRNLSVILSAWIPGKVGWCPPHDLMKRFPVAWVSEKDSIAKSIGSIVSEQVAARKAQSEIASCDGNCVECGRCFGLKRRDGDVLFTYH